MRCRARLLGSTILLLMKSFLSSFAWLTLGFGMASIGWSEGKESTHWKAFQSATDRSPAEILTDYSYAGYEHGEKGIPDVQGPVFKVTDYGAKADDAVSDEDAIRKAVAAAEGAGGGVVFFPAGKFLIWADRKKVEPIRITRSGVVLRGAGCGRGGTVIRLVHSGYGTGPYPVKGIDFNTIPYAFVFSPKDEEKSEMDKGEAVTGAVRRGAMEVPLKSTEGFKPGDWITLKATTPKLNVELMAGLKPDPTWERIIQKGSSISELHQVAAARDGKVVLKDPLLVNLGEDFGVKVARSVMIENTGVEDMTFQGGWRQVFVHHRSALDDEGWDSILFSHVANGWVRRCAFLNLNSGVYSKDSAFCSLLENRFAGTQSHYDLAVRANSTYNLMGLTEEAIGPQHSASTGNRSAGTVVWRWRMTPNSSIDSHGNGPYATLIDRVDGGTMTRSGGPAPSFPNHMRWMVFWNFAYNSDDNQPINLWNYVKGKEAKFVKPLFVGLHGKPVTLVAEALEGNECQGEKVAPDSLYEAQLALRLGKVPDWVGSARKDWEKVMALELPPYGVADIAKHDLWKEEFELGDLIQDWKSQMEKQELEWNVPVEISTPVPAVKWKKDYVLMRTLLQTMATYANPVASKGIVRTPMKVSIEGEGNEVVLRMAVQSDQKSQKKTAENLKVARELAPLCGGTLVVEPTSLKLTLKR
jgi:hypothetical protein